MVSQHTIDTKTFTYTPELLNVLTTVNRCRDAMTLALSLLIHKGRECYLQPGKISMSEKLNDLYRDIIAKVRLFIKQRYERTLDYLLLPCLPGEDTTYKLHIKLTEEELKLNIPSRSLTMTLFRSS